MASEAQEQLQSQARPPPPAPHLSPSRPSPCPLCNAHAFPSNVLRESEQGEAESKVRASYWLLIICWQAD